MENKKIFIGGMCSLPLGVMERQLGNIEIFIPTINYLRKTLGDDINIVTTLQLSPEFCRQFKINSLKIKTMYEPKLISGIASIFDLIRISIWHFIKKYLNLELKFIINSRKIQEIYNSRIYIDFSGDTYSDVAFWGHFLKHSIDLLSIHLLNKKIFMFAQSCAPFTKFLRKPIAKYVLNRVDIITTREDYAFKYLKENNIGVNVKGLSCPSWLYEVERINIEKILEENLVQFRDFVGLNITGYSFSKDISKSDKFKEKRDINEINPFIILIRHLIQSSNKNVLLIPHVFRWDNGSLVPGPDSKVTEQIYEEFKKQYPELSSRLGFIRVPYNASITKNIIGNCEIFIAGRLHAGVAAMSQGIPTSLIAYSTKHFGFSQQIGLEDFVADAIKGNINSDELINKVDRLLKNKDILNKNMQVKLEGIRKKAIENFHIVNELVL